MTLMGRLYLPVRVIYPGDFGDFAVDIEVIAYVEATTVSTVVFHIGVEVGHFLVLRVSQGYNFVTPLLPFHRSNLPKGFTSRELILGKGPSF